MAIAFKKLDVGKLLAEGLEPYPHIRKMVDSLKPEQGLTIISPFLPSPLIEKLKSEGFECRPEHRGDGTWITQFWKE